MTNQNTTRGKPRGQSRMPLILSTEKIIERFESVHGDRYDYSLVEYKGCDYPVVIICKRHGRFEQRADVHGKGKNCPKCVKRHKPTNKEFIDKSKVKFLDKFDYQKTVYINTRSDVTITCRDHGDFSVGPYEHLRSKFGGCSGCNPSGKLALDDFIKRSRHVHSGKYSYNKIKVLKNTRSKVLITCPHHGDFLQIADRHLCGNGCLSCANETIGKKTSMGLGVFVEQARKTHGEKYDYSEVDYVNGYTKVKIKCPIHGYFWQRPHGHLQTRGCEECGDESKFQFRRKDYIRACNRSNNGLSNLYIVKCFNESEEFYKIGITLYPLKRRFSGNTMPYKYSEVRFVAESAAFIWDLEKQIHRLMKCFSYRPKISFGGETECFSELPKEVLKLIDEIHKTDQMQLIA